ncbi:MAG TPA: helix-turn-helix transcriptional regulator [Acidimicrobiia bacterium]|nr:helix-turn-helix transcriptional regulator [Acidimicrobiia bacterium]
MTGASIVREARRRRGISQAELARRLGTTQSAIARLESRRTSPRFETVVAAVRACDLDLHLSVTEPDYDHRRLIEDAFTLSPGQRLHDLVDRLETETRLKRARKL